MARTSLRFCQQTLAGRVVQDGNQVTSYRCSYFTSCLDFHCQRSFGVILWISPGAVLSLPTCVILVQLSLLCPVVHDGKEFLSSDCIALLMWSPRFSPCSPQRLMACSSVPQTDGGNGDLDPGILLTAQTITSETTSSTTTTQITKVTAQEHSGIHKLFPGSLRRK